MGTTVLRGPQTRPDRSMSMMWPGSGRRLTFTVYGRPEPAGSKRGFIVRRKTGNLGVAIADDNPKSKSWQWCVATAAVMAKSRALELDVESDESVPPMFDGPIGIAVVFTLRRPRNHYRTGKRSGELRAGAPTHPVVRPDATKLLRGLEDAMTGIVWRDDAQIVEQAVTKTYGEPEGARVVVWHI